jgi:Tfp pilus assembly protein PilO
MTKIKTWAILAVVAVIAIVAGAWFLALSPQHAKVKDVRAKTASQLQANEALVNQIALLKKQQAQIPGEVARIAAIQKRLPDVPALTSYVRTLSSLASATGVELLSIAPAVPAPVKLPVQAPVAAASAPTAGKSTTASASSAPAGVPTASANLSVIQVAIKVNGDYYAIQQFLKQLEDTQRFTIVDSVTLQPGSPPQPKVQATATPSPGAAGAGTGAATWKTLDADITASVFIVATPATAAASAGGAASVPTTAPHASATAKPSASPSAANN